MTVEEAADKIYDHFRIGLSPTESTLIMLRWGLEISQLLQATKIAQEKAMKEAENKK